MISEHRSTPRKRAEDPPQPIPLQVRLPPGTEMTSKTHTQTQAPTSRNLIGGAWADGGIAVESLNPSTGRPFGLFMSAGAEQATAAIAAARSAFDLTSWSQDARAR